MPDLEKQKQEFLSITALMKAVYVNTPWMFTTWLRKQSLVMSLN